MLIPAVVLVSARHTFPEAVGRNVNRETVRKQVGHLSLECRLCILFVTANPFLEMYLKTTIINKIKDFHKRTLTVIVFIVAKV